MQPINRVQNISVYLFLFFINFQELSLFGIDSISIPKLTGLIYVMTILPQLKIYTRISGIKPFLIPVFLFFGLLTFVGFANINDASSNFFNSSIFLNIIIFWFLVNHGRKEHMILEKGLLFLALGSAVLALFYKAGIGVVITDGRVTMFGDNENIIGLRMSISVIILVLAVVQNRMKIGWERYLLLLPVPVMLKLMAETGARVALLSFVVAFIVGVFLYKTKKYWTKICVFLIGLAFFIYSILLIMQSEVLMLRLLLSYEKGDLAGRETIWRDLIPSIENNLLLGIGQTGYASIFGEGSPHNVILEVLCYTGILGLMLYLYFVFQICLSAYREKTKGYLLPLLLLSPIFGFILSGQILTQKLGWVIFAYIASMSIKKSKENVVRRVEGKAGNAYCKA